MIHWRSLELTSFLSPQTCTVRGLFAECGKWCRLYTLMYFENTFDILHWLGLADFLMHSHRKVLALYPKSHCRSWHSVSFCWSWSSFGSAEEDRGQWHLCSNCSNMMFLDVSWCFSEHRLIRLAELLIGWRTLPGLLCNRDIWHLQSGVEKLYQLQLGRHAVRLTIIMHTAECTSMPANILLCVLFSGWHYILNWHVRKQPRQEMTCLSKLFASMW